MESIEEVLMGGVQTVRKEKIIAKLKPLADRVLVRPFPEADEIDGIKIPDQVKEKPQRGQVLAVGPGIREDGKLVKLDVKPGDKIIYSKSAFTEIEVGGEKLMVMRQDDIIGVI